MGFVPIHYVHLINSYKWKQNRLLMNAINAGQKSNLVVCDITFEQNHTKNLHKLIWISTRSKVNTWKYT